jgi:hypothetical protein
MHYDSDKKPDVVDLVIPTRVFDLLRRFSDGLDHGDLTVFLRANI